VAEYVRDHDGVRGSVADHQASDSEGTISFKGPGYAADLIFEIPSGEYRVLVEEQGLLGVLNDLHKGRDTGSKWKWLIDVSAIFLVAVAITGLGIQVFQRKRRRRVAATENTPATGGSMRAPTLPRGPRGRSPGSQRCASARGSARARPSTQGSRRAMLRASSMPRWCVPWRRRPTRCRAPAIP